MTKKLRISLILLATAIGMISCESLGLSAPKMDTEAAFKRVVEAYEKHIDTTKYHPVDFRWFEIDKLSNDLSYLNVTMISKEDDKAYSQSIKIGGDNQGAEELEPSKFSKYSKYTFDKSNWIRPSDLNAELFLKQIEDAASQIPEDEYNIRSVSDFNVELHHKTGAIQNNFTFRVTKKGEAKEYRGKQVITNYYEVSFDGQADGTAEMKD